MIRDFKYSGTVKVEVGEAMVLQSDGTVVSLKEVLAGSARSENRDDNTIEIWCQKKSCSCCGGTGKVEDERFIEGAPE